MKEKKPKKFSKEKKEEFKVEEMREKVRARSLLKGEETPEGSKPLTAAETRGRLGSSFRDEAPAVRDLC